MKRSLITVALLLLTLTACLPQVAGRNPLTVTVTGATEAVVTLTPEAAAFDIVLYLGRVERVLDTSQASVTCTSVEQLGVSCVLQALDGPLTLTVQAANPSDVSASAWYSVPGGRDQVARATP